MSFFDLIICNGIVGIVDVFCVDIGIFDGWIC